MELSIEKGFLAALYSWGEIISPLPEADSLSALQSSWYF
jgi:hypothetical protein